ncbi:NRDE family protein [Psychrosphaera sp.]|nr:NRDE family protein [Psychrosphaera sp.]
MCSLNWRNFNTSIGLVFTRDESVLRAKALPPQRFSKAGVEYLMPVDPVGKGSWIAANNKGIVFCLLNDYQGKVKPVSVQLVSRGLLIQKLAESSSQSEIDSTLRNWPLKHSQPFYLSIISLNSQRLWHYDGTHLSSSQSSPEQLYSSGHPEVQSIKRLRTEFANRQVINSLSDIVNLHRSHEPLMMNDRAYSFCMHRQEACSQSMTVIEITPKSVEVKYWPGQPCEANLAKPISKTLAIT